MPMPEAAPVTIAVLPEMSIIVRYLSVVRLSKTDYQ
jgi:hypothetical protein